MDYEDDMIYEPTAAERRYPRSAPKAAAASKASAQVGRSFSVRARDFPADNSNYTTRKATLQTPPGLTEESTTPRGLPPAEYLQDTHTDTQQNQEPALEAAAVPAPPSRSNTVRSTNGPKKDWASDRSPLQKLEVTLSGISKEEKRARVQEAEMRLRERMARKKAEREKTETVTPAPMSSLPQNIPPANNPAPRASRKGEQRNDIRESATVDAPAPITRQHGGAAAKSSQYPTVQRPENAIPPSVRLDNVPRRSVTVSGPPGKNGYPGKDVARSQSLSQKAPLAPMQPSDVVLSEETLDTPRAAPTAQDSVESHTKKRQTVSFNVPPPTPPPIFEWKAAPIAQLGATDFDFQHLDMDRSKAWWEGGGTNNRRKSRALPKNYKTPAQKLTGKPLDPQTSPFFWGKRWLQKY